MGVRSVIRVSISPDGRVGEPRPSTAVPGSSLVARICPGGHRSGWCGELYDGFRQLFVVGSISSLKGIYAEATGLTEDARTILIPHDLTHLIDVPESRALFRTMRIAGISWGSFVNPAPTAGRHGGSAKTQRGRSPRSRYPFGARNSGPITAEPLLLPKTGDLSDPNQSSDRDPAVLPPPSVAKSSPPSRIGLVPVWDLIQ